MAGIAIHAEVDVAAHAAMIVVSWAFRVTIRALKYAVVARVAVACRAHTIGSPVIHGEVRVIESGVQPAGRGVARSATGREACGHVVGIRRCLIVGAVAPITIRRQRRVIVVHVTVGAGHVGMRTGQREPCIVVVERSRRPGCCVMANVALLREACGHVVGIRRSLKILQVAVHAGAARQVVVAIRVTLRTLHVSVRPRQRPAGGGVIERRIIPVARAMANLALLRESR